MPISLKDQNSIHDFFTDMKSIGNRLGGIRSDTDRITLNGGGTGCASFACNLIEHCTRKEILNTNLVFYNRSIPQNIPIVNDIFSFFNLPYGSLLAITSNQRTSPNPIIHYVVKINKNCVIGANHGGFMSRRIIGGTGSIGICNLLSNDFIPPYFQYDGQNNFFQLISIDYNLR